MSFYYFYYYFSETIRLSSSCESSARHTIHIKCQVLFSINITKKKKKKKCCLPKKFTHQKQAYNQCRVLSGTLHPVEVADIQAGTLPEQLVVGSQPEGIPQVEDMDKLLWWPWWDMFLELPQLLAADLCKLFH